MVLSTSYIVSDLMESFTDDILDTNVAVIKQGDDKGEVQICRGQTNAIFKSQDFASKKRMLALDYSL